VPPGWSCRGDVAEINDRSSRTCSARAASDFFKMSLATLTVGSRRVAVLVTDAFVPQGAGGGACWAHQPLPSPQPTGLFQWGRTTAGGPWAMLCLSVLLAAPAIHVPDSVAC